MNTIKNHTTGMKYIKSVIQSNDYKVRFNNEIIESLLLFNEEKHIEYLVIKKCSQYKNKLLFYKSVDDKEEKQMFYNDILREYFGMKERKRPNGLLININNIS